MLGCRHLPQGEGSQDQEDPCPLFLRRTETVLGNVFRTVPGRAAGVAATPDLLGSLANLLEHEDGQGEETVFFLRVKVFFLLYYTIFSVGGDQSRRQTAVSY